MSDSILAHMRVVIGADVDDFTRGMGQASKIIDEMSSRMVAAGTTLSIGLTAPLVGLGAAALSATSDMDSLRRGLTAVMGGSAEAAAEFERLKGVAKLPGLGLEEAVQGFIGLKAAGLGVREAEQALLAFGNALATVGKGKAELNAVTVQLQQMWNATSIKEEDLKPLRQAVPQIASIMREIYGTISAEGLRAQGVGPQQFIETIVAELGKLPQVTGGIKNDMENFGDTLKQSLDKIGQAIAPFVSVFVNTLAPGIERMANAFAALPAPAQQAAIAFAGIGAAIGPMLIMFGGMAKGLSSLMDLFGPLKTTGEGMAFLERAALGLNTALKGAGIAAIAFIAAWAGWELLKDIGGSLKELGVSFESVKADITSIVSFIRDNAGTGLFGPMLQGFDLARNAIEYFGVSLSGIQNVLASLAGSGVFGVIGMLVSQMDFSRVTLTWESFKNAIMAGLGPLGSLANALREVVNLKSYFTGSYAEMNTAVTATATASQASAAAWMRYQAEMAGALTTVAKVPPALNAANPHITNHGTVASGAAKGVGELTIASEMARIQQDKHNQSIRDAAKWLSDYGDKLIAYAKTVSGGIPMPDVQTNDGTLKGPPTGIPTVPTLPGPPDSGELDLPTTTEGSLPGEQKLTRMQELTGQVREGINGLTSDIIDSMVHWSSWGDVGRTALEGLKSIGEMVLQSVKDAFLDTAFMKNISEGLSSALSGALSKIPGLGELLGVGGSAASAVAGGAGSAASGAANAAGGATGPIGQAVSGLTGAINMVSGAVSAVAGVFSAIGTFRLEGTMNQVERNTAQLSINMVHLISEMQAWLPRLGDLKEVMYTYMTAFASLMTTIEDLTFQTKRYIDAHFFDRENGGGSSGGNTYQITIENLRDAADVDYLIQQLTERGFLPA